MRSLRESLPLKWSNGRAGSTLAMCLTIWGHIITFSARKQHNIMYIYRVSNVYLSYIFRVCIEIYSGLQAAKLLPFLRDMQENSQSEIYLIEEFYVKIHSE